MNMLAKSSKPFIEQIPAQDRANVRALESIWDAKVTIRWTELGWRYDVRFP